MRAAGGPLRRFVGAQVETERSYALAPNHPAVVEGRPLFPSRVLPTEESARFLVSGHNNAKIGKVVVKGPWAGFPIFTLTLPERATCPRSCPVYSACYGNALHYSPRWDHTDPLFLDTLRAEIITTCRAHPKGLVIRLHVLGDFYSVPYVQMWEAMLGRFPQLHVYGYSARREDADDAESRAIALALMDLRDRAPDRFALRFSRPSAGAGHAIVVEEDPGLPDVIVCPAQTGATTACATCGLCWAPAAADKTIAFLRHGPKRAIGRRVAAAPRVPANDLKKRGWETPRFAISGRVLKGALEGEDHAARGARVRKYIEDHPELTYRQISVTLGVPINVVVDQGASLSQKRARGRRPSYLPPQRCAPAKPMPATPEERIASLTEAERAEIAARYGAVFKPRGVAA